MNQIKNDSVVASTLKQLEKLTEKQLQNLVIEPILEKEGFDNVKDHSGPGEKGADLIATTTELGRNKLYAIQIKKWKLSGSISKNDSLSFLLFQLKQAALEKKIDPFTNNERIPDRVIFITPYIINRMALESALCQLQEIEQKDITIIDGAVLSSLIIKHLPEIITLFSMELQYRMRLNSEITKVRESSAFGLHYFLDLMKIYVGLDMFLGDKRLFDLPKLDAINVHTKIADLTPSLFNQFRSEIGKHSPFFFGEKDFELISSFAEAQYFGLGMKPFTNANFKKNYKKIKNKLKLIVKINRFKKKEKRREVIKIANELLLKSSVYEILKQIYEHNIIDDNENSFGEFEHEIVDLVEVNRKFLAIIFPEYFQFDGNQYNEIENRYKELYSVEKIFEDYMQNDHIESFPKEVDDKKKHKETFYSIVVDVLEFLYDIKTETRDLLKELKMFTDDSLSIKERNSIAKKSILFFDNTAVFLNLPYVSEILDNALKSIPKNQEAPIELSTKDLIDIELPLYVLGNPGSGKTTFMRMFCKYILDNRKDKIPIFISLVQLNSYSSRAITNECLKCAIDFGYNIDYDELIEAMQKGRIILFLDGLDECGSKAFDVMKSITDLDKKFPLCVIHVSCRNTFKFPERNGSLRIFLKPFSESQLGEFVNGWFSAKPSQGEKIQEWLHKNYRMGIVARSPMVAALLCSLCESNVDLPTTEIDLYDKRFRLLLGEWERAKGIQPLSKNIREMYFQFLIKLAYEMHKEEKNSWQLNKINKLAQLFYKKSFHVKPDNLVLDCIQRGILLSIDGDRLTFGHLTYQEFLVGNYLGLAVYF